ncbi:hypothetical protein [Sutcliffiella cohnii]|uniref:hypothetical protein n=1 Tax=Sutcliffiella cohnii TaxID=33932 RepID=UPI0008330D67|nr:hypothetical protein [Sutcliffiella cohnii]
MKRNLIILISIFLTIIGYITYTMLVDNGEAIDLEQSASQVLEDVERVKNQETAYTWLETKNMSDGYLETHLSDMTQRQRIPENVIQFLFGTILVDDPELFVQAFDTETISKDLFAIDNPDKLEVASDIMNRISRDSKLERVGIINTKGSVGQEVTVRIAISYSDGLEIKFPITMRLQRNSHGEDNSIYFISSSVWDLIKVIESK